MTPEEAWELSVRAEGGEENLLACISDCKPSEILDMFKGYFMAGVLMGKDPEEFQAMVEQDIKDMEDPDCEYCGEKGTPENPVTVIITSPPTDAPFEEGYYHKDCADAYTREAYK